MDISTEDLDRVAYEIRHFINKASLTTRTVSRPKLMIEVPTVDVMFELHQALLQALDVVALSLAYNHPVKRVGIDVVEVEFGGLTFSLKCTHRVRGNDGRLYGYNQITDFRLG